MVAIHQPTFFPWLGFFDKVARSDVFIVLDHVQFPKSRPGSWLNRVRLLVNGEAQWVTMPVQRGFEGVRRIDQILIDDRSPWRRKLLQLLRTNYGRAACFRDTFPVVEPLVLHPAERLVDYNSHAFTAIARQLGLPTHHIVHSAALDVDGKATELLIALVRCVGGTTYLSGDGAGGYQEDARFDEAGLPLTFQSFVPPAYPQGGDRPHVPGLSVLDALFHCGFEGTARLINAASARRS